MAIISQETWDNMPKEEKEKLRKEYQILKQNKDAPLKTKLNEWYAGRFVELEELFGKENLHAEVIEEKCVEPIKECFDMQTQDTEWNKCTEQEQQNILEIYNNHPEWTDVINALEDKFGEHNLQPKTKIRTWEDVAINKPEVWDNVNKLGQQIANCVSVGSKLYKKLVATIHIQKLIELGYGGMVTEEEWKDGNVEKASIVYLPFKKNFDIHYNSLRKEFITFHSKRQAEEFMSYPENRALAEQYYMI